MNGDLRVLKAALFHAVRLHYLRSNPVCDVDMLPAPVPPPRVLSPEECQKLINGCPNDHWRAFVVVALTTGMRRSELLALEWGDVDLLTGMVQVSNKKDRATKSRKNRLTSTTPEGTRLLTMLRVAHPEGKKVFLDTGGELTVSGIRNFRKIAEEAGVKDCTLHDLRRTSLTMLATRLPAFALQQRAGHTDPHTTATYYIGDLAKESAKVAEGVFGSVFKVKGQ